MGLLSAKEAATLLGLSPQTLAVWRLRGAGPAFCKLGSRCLYAPDEIERWVSERRRTSTSDKGAEGSGK